jgi:predicted ATP-dependent endonuclease of OLD family
VDKEFLHKYLSLTKCDLYFADKAILIEGATERLLLPEIIKKSDAAEQTKLRSKYLSVIEVGGAYMHHFYKFIDFLELKTLIITDIDSVKKTVGEITTTYPSSMFREGTHTSNVGLSNWYGFDGYIELTQILNKPETDKVSGCRRISYQIAEDGSVLIGRSFEDAFILANLEKFNLHEVGDNELEEKVYNEAKKIGKNSKANFAIQYSIDETDWNVPKYIAEGLTWLDCNHVSSTQNTIVDIGIEELSNV